MEISLNGLSKIRGPLHYSTATPTSGHPLACAAGLAALDISRREELLTRAAKLSDYWENALHGLHDLPHVIDIRNIGLMGAVKLCQRGGDFGTRGGEVMKRAFEKNVMVRFTGDTIALAPALIVEHEHIDRIIEVMAEILRDLK